MKNILLTFSLIIMTATFGLSQIIDTSQSVVELAVKNLGFNKVKGTIKGMTGTVVFNPEDLSNAKFSTSVQIATINTGNKKRDKHLRSEDFFEIEKYPAIRFESQKIEKTADGYSTTGTLTIKDVSKTVQLPFIAVQAGDQMTLTGTLMINRKEYNVGSGISNFMANEEANLTIICVLTHQ